MKTFLLFCLTLCMGFASAQLSEPVVEKIWSTPDVLTTSESVLYNDQDKMIFVACINGNPTEKDGNGFISQISLSGEVVTFHWATGLNAPKGMGIANNSLFVTDIDRIVQFNLEDGSFQNEYPVEGAGFMNDITVDPQGNVYATDMASTSIYRLSGEKISLWISDEQFVNPNGLNHEKGQVLLGTKNGIFTIDTETKAIRHIVKNTGGIDGLEILEEGVYIISDWQGKVQIVQTNKEPILLFNTTEEKINAADINYVADRNLLLVPTFFDNRVTAYEIRRNK